MSVQIVIAFFAFALFDACHAQTAPLIPVKPLTAPAIVEPGLALWGDSMAADSWSAIVAKELKFDLFNDAVGGSSSTAALERKRADATHRNWLTIYWTGHNHVADQALIVADIKRMIALQAPPRRFLVLLPVQRSVHAVTSVWYRNTMFLAADLMKTFPDNFLDLRYALAAAARDTEEDRKAVANGITPPSLCRDEIHFNEAGNAVVAQAVLAEIRKRGWDRAGASAAAPR